MYELVVQRLLGAISLALVAATILAAGAHGAPRPDDRPGARGVGAVGVAVPDALDRAVAGTSRSAPVRPDDASAPRGPGGVSPVLWQTPKLIAGGSSFHWADAALGAAVAAAGLLVAGAITARTRRRVALP